jgi:hypothetical protein
MDWTFVMHLAIGVFLSYLDHWNWSAAWIGLDFTSTAYFPYISFFFQSPHSALETAALVYSARTISFSSHFK